MKEKTFEDKIVYLSEDEKTVLAEIDFPLTGEKEVTITHTFVDNSLRGQGIAGKLMEQALAINKEKGYTIKATCSYAVHYLEKHPQ